MLGNDCNNYPNPDPFDTLKILLEEDNGVTWPYSNQPQQRVEWIFMWLQHHDRYNTLNTTVENIGKFYPSLMAVNFSCFRFSVGFNLLTHLVVNNTPEDHMLRGIAYHFLINLTWIFLKYWTACFSAETPFSHKMQVIIEWELFKSSIAGNYLWGGCNTMHKRHLLCIYVYYYISWGRVALCSRGNLTMILQIQTQPIIRFQPFTKNINKILHLQNRCGYEAASPEKFV